MCEALFDNECLLKAIQQNRLTSEIFFENTPVHSHGNMNLPSFFFVFSENIFSQISGSISIAVGRISVPVGVRIRLDCCCVIIRYNIAKNCIASGSNIFTFIFYSLFNFC